MVTNKGKRFYEYLDKPVETVNTFYNVKCFTFFSHTNKLWKNIKFNLNNIEVIIYPVIEWLPLHLIDQYYFSIHSPSIIPKFTKGINFIAVRTAVIAKVSYCKVSVNIEYDSDCDNYDHGDIIDSDCPAICFMKRYQLEHGHKYVNSNPYLFRKGYYELFEKFDPSMKVKNLSYNQFDQDCMTRCKPSCQTSYFIYDIDYQYNYEISPLLKFTRINIQHNYMPDIHLRHLPEVTLISFISNFGGLLGMWLGLSVLIIFERFRLVFNHLVQNFYQTNSNNLLFINYTNSNINYTNNYNKQLNTNINVTGLK